MRKIKNNLLKIALAALAVLMAAPGAARAEHFYLSLYHFNLQYVAGDVKAEDKVVIESFEPLVDLYLKHPGWGAGFEMQGYMIEVMQQRFPDVLDKFKTIVNRGQVDLVCFHYSDQLFLAYPRADMEWSDRLTRRALEFAGIKRSPVVFTQEGQFGEGMLNFMVEHGTSIGLIAKNHFKLLHGDGQPDPWFEKQGATMIVVGRGQHLPDYGIDMDWTFFNDGELLATGGASPYMPEFYHKPEAVKEYEDRLLGYEAAGGKIANITDYAKALEAAGVPKTKDPSVLDGTWQPADTGNLYRWMGDYRAMTERDNEVLTSNVKSRNKLLAAGALAEYAKSKGLDVSSEANGIEQGWRRQMFAEVSDSTGWMPFVGETNYSLNNSERAAMIAQRVADSLKKTLGMTNALVDLRTGAVTDALGPQEGEGFQKTDCPAGFDVSAEDGSVTLGCFTTPGGPLAVEVEFKVGNAPHRLVAFSVPMELDKILYSPALLEDRIESYPLSDFEWQEWTLPLPNGLIGVGPDKWIVKKTDVVHLAAHIDKESKTISFKDALSPAGKEGVWQFYYIEGTQEEALAFADKLNVRPVVGL